MSYLGRYSYSSNITHMMDRFDVSHAEAGLVVTLFFFAYGAGQFIHGLFSRRYNKQVLFPVVLTVSAAANLAVFLGLPFRLVKYAWLINGFALSVLWSSIVAIMAEYLDGKHLKISFAVLGSTTAAGTFITYFSGSIFSGAGHFMLSFVFAAAVLLLVAACWMIFYRKTVSNIMRAAPKPHSAGEGHARESGGGDPEESGEPESFRRPGNVRGSEKVRMPENARESSVAQDNGSAENDRIAADSGASHNGKARGALIATFAVFVLFAVACNFLKDGLQTWVPDMMKELYGLQDTVAILVSLILPLLSAFCGLFTVFAQKYVRNVTLLTALFFGAGLVLTLLLRAFMGGGFLIAAILFGLISFMTHSINTCITAVMPLKFNRTGKAGLISGVLNGFCYAGSTASAYGLGSVADNAGWNTVFAVFVFTAGIAAAAGIIVAAVTHRPGKPPVSPGKPTGKKRGRSIRQWIRQ